MSPNKFINADRKDKNWLISNSIVYTILIFCLAIEFIYFRDPLKGKSNRSVIEIALRARACAQETPYPTLPLQEIYKKEVCVLNLNSINLSVLTHEIGEFSSLQELYLAGNKLLDLPVELSNIQLEYLDLGDNKFEKIPNIIYSLNTLNKLEIGFNKIKNVPANISSLKNLKRLSLNNNKINAIDPAIFQLKHLEFLELGNNMISNFPEANAESSNLKELYLYNNQLTSFLPDIWKFPSLKVLDLRNNKIQIIPQSISALNNLKRLEIAGNPLHKDDVKRLRKSLPSVQINF